MLLILDKSSNPCPVNEKGELYILGDGVARGYLNDPDKTSGAFVEYASREKKARRLYKTGDLVRCLPDGNIEFLGRIDHQVKIKGIR